MPRTKMTRHQLKEQDEITTSLKTFTDLVMARQKEVIIGVSAVALLVIIFFGWRYYSASRNESAGTQLSQAINIYNDTVNIKTDKERYEKTIVEAQKTYDQYRSLPAGSIALYYISMCQEGLGDTAKATQGLQEVSQRGDASIKAVAQFALAMIYRKHGDVQKAADIYKQLYNSGDYSKSAATYELATMYEGIKQMDQAKDYYQKLVKEFPDSPFRQYADEALKRLGVLPVEAPPPPKPS